jgi:uncharacterized protein (TIGR03067 family)
MEYRKHLVLAVGVLLIACEAIGTRAALGGSEPPAKKTEGLTPQQSPGKPDHEEPTIEGKTVGQWVTDLRNGRFGERLDAAQALERFGPAAKRAVPALTEALKDWHELVRVHAARALGSIGPDAKEAVPGLIAVLKDREVLLDKLRPSAAAALGSIGAAAEEVIPALLETLKERDPHLRLQAAAALGKIGPTAKDALPALTAAWQNEEKASIRLCLIEALVRSDSEGKSTGALLAKEDHLEVRSALALALGRQGPRASKALPALMKAFQDEKHSSVRLHLLEALVQIDPQGQPTSTLVVNALGAMTSEVRQDATEEDLRVQGALMRALVQLGPAAVPSLVAGLKNPKAAVRAQAALALGRIGPGAKDAVTGLTKVLKDQDPLARARAAAALGRIGPTATAAMPALVVAFKDEDSAVQLAAAVAVIKLGSLSEDAKQTSSAVLKAALRGNWKLISYQSKAEETSHDVAHWGVRVALAGERFTVNWVLDGKAVETLNSEGTYKINPIRVPMTLDITGLPVRDEPELSLGILEFEEDRIKICLAEPGQKRPTTFTTKPGLGQVIIVLRREKP